MDIADQSHRIGTLHGYFRSAASWRVRIALGLKGLAAIHQFHHLRRGGQRAPSYLAITPRGSSRRLSWPTARC